MSANGKRGGRKVPAWLADELGRLGSAPDDGTAEAEAEIVAAIARARDAGLSIRAIADELRRLGTRPTGGDTK